MSATVTRPPLCCPTGCGQVFMVTYSRTERTGQDIVSHIQRFMSEVSDPSDPACCPRCFSIIGWALDRNCSPTCCTLNTLRLHMHDFWILCLRILAVLSECRVSRVRQTLEYNCHVCPYRRSLHAVGVADQLSDPFEMLLDGLYAVLIPGLSSGKQPLVQDDGSYKYFHKRRGYWPLSPEQLFPLGVQRGVDALVFWCSSPINSAQFALLTAVMNSARSIVVPRLLASPTRDRLLWAITQAITPSNAAVAWPRSGPSFAIASDLSTTRGDVEIVNSVLQFLTLFRDDVNARADETTRLLAGYERPFRQALTVVSQRCADDPHIGIAHYYLNMLSGAGAPHHPVSVLHEFLVLRRVIPTVDPFLEPPDFARAFAACELEEKDVQLLLRWARSSGLLPATQVIN
ncbi:hypothetical protein AURDEDRAFT_129634 [Auricularia subglabra TFB-10046 SS5]|nr:hypothetical protein AURDEDRAFT_129634 [Auricularia subglabra TFB-10046 SS5]